MKSVYWSSKGDGRYKRSQIKSDRTSETYASRLFPHNPEYCIDIIYAHKTGIYPASRVYFSPGCALGGSNRRCVVAISYEKLPDFSVSTVHGHAGELVLGHLAVPYLV